MSEGTLASAAVTTALRQPRLGFLGTGAQGREQIRAIAASGLAEVVAIAEPTPAALRELDGFAPEAARMATLTELLGQSLDGIVIGTPNAQHAGRSIQALEAGVAVFCQRPLGRTAAETRQVIDAAKRANRLLGVDLPYRFTEAMRVLRAVVQAGELGDVYAVELIFHHAHGPERSWGRDRSEADGGCATDLGLHVIDLALWTLGFPRVTRVRSRLYARGELLHPPASACEDYATALLELDTGATVRLACSWDMPTGRDAILDVSFYGTEGGGAFRNVNDSLRDFTAELFRGTSRHLLASPPDAWEGRAVVDWVSRVAGGAGYDPWIEGLIDVAAALDAVLHRAG